MGNGDNSFWKCNLVLVGLSQLLILAGFAGAMTFIPLFFKSQFGIEDEGTLGLYVSWFNFFGALGYAVSCPIWGMLSDRFGVRPMLLRGTFGTALIFPLMIFCDAPWQLIALRFLSAACAGTTSASNILIVKNTPENKQGFALGILTAAVYAGTMLGNVLGGLAVHYYGYNVAFVSCGIFYFVAGIFVLFIRDSFVYVPKTQHTKKKSSFNPSSLLNSFTTGVWMLLGIMLLLSCARNFEVPYTAMMIELITGPGDAAYWTGIISACVSVGALLSGVVTGYMSDRIRPTWLIVPSLVISAVLLLIQGLATSLWVFCISRTLMYFFAGGLTSVFQKLLAGAAPRRKRGKVFGWYTTVSSAGVMFSTIITGGVIYLIGTRGVYIGAGMFLLLILLPVSLLVIRALLKQPFFAANTAELFKRK